MKPRILLLALLACATPAYSTDGSVITSDEASRALRDGLYQGTRASLSRLGRENGYFGNPRVKIGLPKNFARTLPNNIPVTVIKKQTTPMINAGKKTGTFNMEKLNPTANASILVAMESRNKGQPRV